MSWPALPKEHHSLGILQRLRAPNFHMTISRFILGTTMAVFGSGMYKHASPSEHQFVRKLQFTKFYFHPIKSGHRFEFRVDAFWHGKLQPVNQSPTTISLQSMDLVITQRNPIESSTIRQELMSLTSSLMEGKLPTSM